MGSDTVAWKPSSTRRHLSISYQPSIYEMGCMEMGGIMRWAMGWVLFYSRAHQHLNEKDIRGVYADM